jgi:hypothetical protein
LRLLGLGSAIGRWGLGLNTRSIYTTLNGSLIGTHFILVDGEDDFKEKVLEEIESNKIIEK